MLGKPFHDDTPLFLQIKERIEEQILQDHLLADAQIPSTTQIVAHYKINHITVTKGINLLVDAGIVYKKRGVGMFVATDAKAKLLAQRASEFGENYVVPLVHEAKNLNLTRTHVIELIEKEF